MFLAKPDVPTCLNSSFFCWSVCGVVEVDEDVAANCSALGLIFSTEEHKDDDDVGKFAHVGLDDGVGERGVVEVDEDVAVNCSALGLIFSTEEHKDDDDDGNVAHVGLDDGVGEL